ncbi:hypothetical protein BV20DRAFT_480261 [Pilatotrama ljubarskyi]|nr:hypothetical protein BV20DRAFT_480261 [Pilatotrama ljubarskyi]
MVTTQGTAPEQPPPSGGTAGAVANESATPVEEDEGRSTATADSIKYPWTFDIERPWVFQRDVSRRFTESEKAQAWSRTTDIVKTYSDDLIKRLNAEIDTLLVYAGLFSAVVTAFNVESYVLLQPQTPDPSLAVLERISAQLGSSSVHTPSLNQTEPSSPLLSASPSLAPAWTVWLNIFWFSSLMCSLAAASIGIAVKQWLQEYSSGLSGTSRHTARLRQRRLNSLTKWRVADITAALPVMLQLALGLYCVGLLILLWNLHPVVAALASALVALLFMFTLATSVLPLFRDDCSYLSTQSLALYALWIKVYPPGRQLSYRAIRSCVLAARWLSASIPWRVRRHLRRLPHLPAWSKWTTRLQETPELLPIAYQTWRGREHTTVNALHDRLDADMLAQAFDVCLDEDYLDIAAMGITELTYPDVMHCCERLTHSLAKHVKPVDPDSEGINPLILRHRFWSSLVVFLCVDNRRHVTMDRLEWLAPSGTVVFHQKDVQYGLLHSFFEPPQSMVQRDHDPRDVVWLSMVLPALAKDGDYKRSPLTMIWASYAVCTWREPIELADSKLAASIRRQSDRSTYHGSCSRCTDISSL